MPVLLQTRGMEATRRRFKNDPLTEQIIRAAIEVHRILGPGLLESAYHECLCYELKSVGLRLHSEVFLPVIYKELRLERVLRPDLIVEDAVVVEIKTVETILRVHEAQLLTYLRLSGLDRGLLFNFFSAVLKDGVRRLNLSFSHRTHRLIF